MTAHRPRVVLVGLGSTTGSALEGLAAELDVIALVRDTDDAVVGRARQTGARVLDDARLANVRAVIEEVAPDAVVVSSYNRIIPADLLVSCPFVNVHYAPLPRGRGRATVNWALINGDDSAWITIHHLVPELDAGGILYQGAVPIDGASTVATLYDALNALQRRELADCVRRAIAGDPGRPQDEARATYLCTRVPSDGDIDWSRSAIEIDRLVRALQPPFPYASTWLGLGRFEVESAHVVDPAPVYEGRVSGRVARVDRDAGTVDVLCGDGLLCLERVRVDGRSLPAAEHIRSMSATLGPDIGAMADAVRDLTAAVADLRATASTTHLP